MSPRGSQRAPKIGPTSFQKEGEFAEPPASGVLDLVYIPLVFYITVIFEYGAALGIRWRKCGFRGLPAARIKDPEASKKSTPNK